MEYNSSLFFLFFLMSCFCFKLSEAIPVHLLGLVSYLPIIEWLTLWMPLRHRSLGPPSKYYLGSHTLSLHSSHFFKIFHKVHFHLFYLLHPQPEIFAFHQLPWHILFNLIHSLNANFNFAKKLDIAKSQIQIKGCGCWHAQMM